MSSKYLLGIFVLEDILKLTNFILGSGATCHMTPEISDFIPGSLVETDKYINVADGYFFAAKQIGQIQIGMLNENGKLFIDMLYNLILAP